MKKSVGETVVDNITTLLFESARIDRDKFQKQAKQAIRKDFDHFLLPIKLNNEEKQTRTGLANLVCSNLDPNVQITSISQGNFYSFLRIFNEVILLAQIIWIQSSN
jgi:hypothetical protein